MDGNPRPKGRTRARRKAWLRPDSQFCENSQLILAANSPACTMPPGQANLIEFSPHSEKAFIASKSVCYFGCISKIGFVGAPIQRKRG